jgi:hypothetical protein
MLATKHTTPPMRPRRAELEPNPRAPRARLRAAERVEASTGPF